MVVVVGLICLSLLPDPIVLCGWYQVFDSDTGFKDEYVGEADVFFSTEDIKTDPITGRCINMW